MMGELPRNQSYAEMFRQAENEMMKRLDQYFEKKVKQLETNPSKYIDPYPEELYDGISCPRLLYTHSKNDWDVMLFNRKLMAYKVAYLLNGQEFFDKEYTLPVSKGWEFYSSKFDPTNELKLSFHHWEICKSLKLTPKEYYDTQIPKAAEIEIIKTPWWK